MVSLPEKPKKTEQQKLVEVRQRGEIDKSIEEEEDLFKLLASGKLGRTSLLSGAPKTATTAAGGSRGGGAGGAGSLLSGGPGANGTRPGRTGTAKRNDPGRGR